MARIRSIKPETPQSESLGNVSRDARLTFLFLWTLADDDGRLRGNSRMLASLLFPYDDDAPSLMDGWLTELDGQDCIRRYSIDGHAYIEIVNWLKHQKIDKPSQSKLPPFVEGSRTVSKPREPSALDRKGLEGIGEEGKGGDGADAPPALDEAFDEWNSLAEQTGLAAVQHRSAGRRKALKARLSEAGGIEGWRLALAKIRGSPFLLGQTNGKDHPNWRADFDFIVGQKQFTKLMEGGYDQRPNGHRQSDSDRLKAGLAAAFADVAGQSPAD